jgi:hypothetical protein
MRPKTVYYAAFRRGRILPWSVLDTPAQVRRYVRAMFADKVAAGCYRMSEVFYVNSVTVEKIMIVRFGAHRTPARRAIAPARMGSPNGKTLAAPG